ncbi:MAG: outer membrane protein transport protein [Gammaproteobacteria bacterium]
MARYTIRRRALTTATFCAFIPLASPPASAGGFQITENCAKCQGHRNAGMAADTDAPGAGYFNPAAVSRVAGTQFDLSAHGIFGQFQFQDEGSTNAFGRPQRGARLVDGAEDAYVPNLHVTHQLGERFGVGLQLAAPYGLATDYRGNWTGRYHALRSELVLINANLNLAWNVTDRWSVGAGLAYQSAEAELSNALDFGAVARVVLPELSPVPIPPDLLPDSGDAALDGNSRLEGDDSDWGWTAGILYTGESTRIGVGYRSEIEHEIAGTVTVTVPGPLQDALGFDRRVTRGTARVSTPASFTLGVQQDLNPEWTVMFGTTWTDWSVFDALIVEDSEGNILSNQPEEWEDSWRYSVGFEYRYAPNVTLRMGAEYDETPVPGERLTARIPDEDRYWLSAGATWQLSERVFMDFAWTHIWVPDYEINEEELSTGGLLEQATGTIPGAGNTLVGSFDAKANVLSLGFRMAW